MVRCLFSTDGQMFIFYSNCCFSFEEQLTSFFCFVVKNCYNRLFDAFLRFISEKFAFASQKI